MKKIYAFFAAALLSVSVFAAPEKVPTVAELAASYDVANDVVLCLYFDEAVCNDVVFAGNYNCWATDDLTKFQPLEGFEGWYVVSVPFQNYVCDPDNNPDGELPKGKPVQLKDGNFSWDYQSGDVDAWVNLNVEGSKVINVTAGYSGESDEEYPEAGAYIYEVAYFKNHNSPCVFVPTHKYTIVLYAPACGDLKPALSGNFNGWATPPTPMNEDVDEDFNTIYTYVIEDEEGHEFKFREVNDDSNWSNQLQYLNDEGLWVNFDNIALPVASGDTTLEFDYSDGTKYRYGLCGADDSEYTVAVSVKLPAGAPAAGVEIIGSFNEWADTEKGGEPVVMELQGDVYVATIVAKESQEFKFREAGTWDNEVVYVESGDGLPNMRFGDFWEDVEGGKALNLDLSSPEVYTWKILSGIENIIFEPIEGVRKVVIDGHLYIQKGETIYDVMGAQVR